MKRWLKLLIIGFLACGLSLLIPVQANTHNNPLSIVQLAQQQYQQGQFTESIELLQQAASFYQTSQNYLQQAQVLSLISLGQQQLGAWQQAQKTLESSFNLLATVPESQAKQQVLAQIWNSKAQLELSKGESQQAFFSWQEAEKLYSATKDDLGVRGSLVNQAEALENLGFYRRSCDTILQAFQHPEYRCEFLTEEQLKEVLQTVKSDAHPWQIVGLNNMANSLLLMGKLLMSQTVVAENQILIKRLKESSPFSNSKLLLSLGNVQKFLAFQAQEQNDNLALEKYSSQAINSYQKIEKIYRRGQFPYLCRLQVQLNHLNLLIGTKRWGEAQQVVKQIDLKSDLLKLNRQSLYAAINFAYSLKTLKEKSVPINYSWQEIGLILENASQQAQTIDDKRAKSYALGYLGQIQSQHKLQLANNAQQLLQQALSLSQSINAPELSYRWQWELGKIYREQNKINNAIIAYQAAFESLQSLRSDLVALNQEIQFSFRQQVEPVYREFAELLLIKQSLSKQKSPENLQLVKNIIESLQLAELDNYFKDACLTFQQRNIEQIDASAAIIHTIIFPQRLEVILSLPDQTLVRHSQPISSTELDETIQQLRIYLKEPDRLRDVQQLASQVYDWLIRPFEQNLTANPPQTLVFVLDGVLQNIPMSVLYDGNKYLVENYAIAITPGLRLLVPESSQKIQTLAAGVSQERQVATQNFSALNNVSSELKTIESTVKSRTLLNAQFTETNLINQLNAQPFSILHLATHGQFSSDPNQTFILLWDRLLNIRELSNILQNTNQTKDNYGVFDLLVLSACETAIGDKRAALGLSGMAVRTGASTTLGTLWQISDESTAVLMTNFYRNLNTNPQITKAEALRLAQLSLQQNSAKDWQIPAFWAGYILVGNWQ